MNIIKKAMISVLLGLSVLGLTTSLSAFADGASDTALYCSGCHTGLTVNGVVIGGGAKLCPQRTVSEWTTTIDRMNGKGCGVPAGSIAGIASYLAGLGSSTTSSSTTTSTTTTTTFFERCSPWNKLYISTNPTSLSFTATEGGTIPASQSLTVYASVNQSFLTASWYASGIPVWLSISPTGGSQGSTQVTASITSTQLSAGVYAATIYFTAQDGCPYDMAGTSLPVTFTIDPSTSTTATSSTTTTTSSTTSTTLCNAYVNGTTQYPYSGSGSCHSFTLDLVTGAHIVRDQKYCQQHMSHFNSSGNHVHAYPHPVCM